MGRKNVLLLMADQHRADWMPGVTNGLRLNMPNLKALMQSGVTFSDCVTPSPLCAPARACLATGNDYDHCCTYNNRCCMPLDMSTIYRLARDRGYRVGNAGKLDLHKPCLYWGENGWIPQLGTIGFTDAIDSEGKWDTLWANCSKIAGPYGNYLKQNDQMEAYSRDYTERFFNPMRTEPTGISDDGYADNFVARNAIKILETLESSDAPWFMTVNFSGPHDPWDITNSMAKSTNGTNYPLPRSYSGDCAELLKIRQNYAAMLENIDRNIGLLLKQLRDSGQYDDTLIIYTSDHGEMLGDRNMFYKSKPYRAAIQVPLVMCGNGLMRGETVDSPVQLQDVSATIAEWCGFRLRSETDGRSLMEMASSKDAKPIRDHQISKLVRSITNDNPFRGYEEYSAWRKTKTDREFFGELCEKLHMEWKGIPKVQREEFGDWVCLKADGYKLILFSNGRRELYREDDIEEQNNLFDSLNDVAEQMQMKYNPSVAIDTTHRKDKDT